MDCGPPGFSVRGISWARILDWVAVSLSRGSSQPRDWTWISCIAGRFFAAEPPVKPTSNPAAAKSLQSYATLSDPMDCRLPSSSIHGIFQARVLEWVAIAFSSSNPAAAKSLQLCLTLSDPTDDSPPGSPIPGILQARTLECVAISFSNAWKWKVKVKSLSRVRLFSNPMDYSLPGSSIHGIFQARVLEWGVIAFSN